MSGATARPLTSSGGTAKTLILVGLILQLIQVLVVFAFGLVTLIFLIGILFIGASILGLIWLVLVFLFSYRPTGDGDYEGARTPTLVFAILSLLTVNLISGILYLIAYVKLGDAAREQQQQRQATTAAAGYYSPSTLPQAATPYAVPPPTSTGPSGVLLTELPLSGPSVGR